MAWTDVRGVRTYYTSSGGGGRTLVLVHGWCSDSTTWTRLIAELEPDHRVVVPDLRGHGRSETGGTGFSPFVLADDVLALAEQLTIDDAVVVGHSLGGVVASIMAVRRPDLVSAVVLLDPSYGREQGHADRVRTWIGDIASADSHERAIRFVSTSVSASSGSEEAQVARRRRAEAMTPEVIWSALADLHLAPDQISTRPESSRYLVRREVPVLAVHADKQRSDWERTLVRRPEVSRVEYWPDVTHWVHHDAPQRVVATLRDWLADVRPAPSTATAERPPQVTVDRAPLVDVHVHLGVTVTRSPVVGQSAVEVLDALARTGAASGVLSPAGGAGLEYGIASVRADNNAVAATIAAEPERLPLGLAGADLRLGTRAAVDELERAMDELGLHGLCLFPKMSGHRLDGAVVPLLSVLDIRHGLCLLHPADDLEEALERCAAEFPQTTFVLTHAPMSDLHALQRLASAGNVYFDLSQNTAVPCVERLRSLVDAVGAGRLLFGGDSPYFSPSAQHDALVRAGFPAEVHERITWRNASELIRVRRPDWRLPS